MLFHLSLKNIKERKFRSLLASFSIAIGTASLIIFLGLSHGIKTATFEEIEKSNPLTQITVRPSSESGSIISFFDRSDDRKLNQESLDKISKIQGIKNIYPEIQFNNFASINIKLLGFSLITDTMIFGIEKDFLKDDLKNNIRWDQNEEPYPAIIPRKLLDMYNLTIATTQGLPLVSEENMIGKELILYPQYSTFFPQLGTKDKKIKLEIVAFSDKVNLIGATLPLHIVENLNTEFGLNKNNHNFLEIFVETQDASITSEVAKKIENLGFKTVYYQKNLQSIEAKFKYLSISLGSISLIILLTAAISIISTFLATIAERRKEIGLLRALGANKLHIKKIILFEAGIIGFIGSIIGVVAGVASSKIIDHYGLTQLKSTSFSPESLFIIDYKIIISTILFGILLSMASAFIPALKASNLDPIKALN